MAKRAMLMAEIRHVGDRRAKKSDGRKLYAEHLTRCI
jgi:hypothetical protein